MRIHRQRLCWLIRIIGAGAYDAFARAGNADARVGFIQALRRADIASQADTGFCRRREGGLHSSVVERHEVPGNQAIPLRAQQMSARWLRRALTLKNLQRAA